MRAQILAAAGAMLFAFLQIVHDAFAFQMRSRGFGHAPVRMYRYPALPASRGRIFAVVFVLSSRGIFHLHALSRGFGGEQRQLFFAEICSLCRPTSRASNCAKQSSILSGGLFRRPAARSDRAPSVCRMTRIGAVVCGSIGTMNNDSRKRC